MERKSKGTVGTNNTSISMERSSDDKNKIKPSSKGGKKSKGSVSLSSLFTSSSQVTHGEKKRKRPSKDEEEKRCTKKKRTEKEIIVQPRQGAIVNNTIENKKDDFLIVESVLNSYSKPKVTKTIKKKPNTKKGLPVKGPTKIQKLPSLLINNDEEEKSNDESNESLSNSIDMSEKDDEENENSVINDEDEENNVLGQDSLRKNAEKWLKRSKQLPERLGLSRLSDTKTTAEDDSSSENDSDNEISIINGGGGGGGSNTTLTKNIPKETRILEDRDTRAYIKKAAKKLKERERSKRAEGDSLDDSDESFSDKDDEDELNADEGSYVRLTPAGIESKLIEIAKRGHTDALQGAAINDLMRINRGVFCDNIDQDPLTNPYYDDPNKTNVDYHPKDTRANYIDHVVKSWIDEDFIRTYQTTETMVLLEQYTDVIKTLEEDNDRKKITLKTKVEDLPKIEASYIASFLREPILDLGERRCVAGDNCISYYLFDHIQNNASLNSTQLNPASGMNIDANKGIWTKKDDSNQPTPQRRGTTGTASPNGSGGFILREFLLPAQKSQIETEVNLGIPMKEALDKIERKHCILCNRYITTVLAARISAGVGEVPSNTIQDHRNYFECVGQYNLNSMLYFCGDYCGIIGEMVAFKISDYALATIEQCRYNMSTPEEKEAGKPQPDRYIRLRAWVEKNLITGMKNHEEGKNNKTSIPLSS